jgi:hypothetical protein
MMRVIVIAQRNQGQYFLYKILVLGLDFLVFFLEALCLLLECFGFSLGWSGLPGEGCCNVQEHCSCCCYPCLCDDSDGDVHLRGWDLVKREGVSIPDKRSMVYIFKVLPSVRPTKAWERSRGQIGCRPIEYKASITRWQNIDKYMRPQRGTSIQSMSCLSFVLFNCHVLPKPTLDVFGLRPIQDF